ETVLIEKQDGITWLIMNRPDKRNAMSPQLHLDMDDALAELAVDPQTQVLVLTGAGEAFCAGQDIKLYFRANDDAPAARARARQQGGTPAMLPISGAGNGSRPSRSRPSPWSTATASAAVSPRSVPAISLSRRTRRCSASPK